MRFFFIVYQFIFVVFGTNSHFHKIELCQSPNKKKYINQDIFFNYLYKLTAVHPNFPF